MQARISFRIYGKPEPAGSKRSLPIYNRNTGQPLMKAGRVIVNTVDANKKAAPWKHEVARIAAQAMTSGPWDSPVRLFLVFVLARPKGHYGTGRNAGVIRQSAPRHPTSKPDVGKLARGIEDALTGVVYRDDALIHTALMRKRYARAEEPAHTKVFVVRES